MKTLLVLVCLVMFGAAFAGYSTDGNYSIRTTGDEGPGSDDEINITVLNTWAIPAGDQALGIDFIDMWYQDNVIVYIDNDNDTIWGMDTDDGSSISSAEWPLDANNTNPFGICLVNHTGAEKLHVNDFGYDGIFAKYFADPWLEYNSLTDNMGRGMDYHAGSDKIFEFYTITNPGAYQWHVAMYTPEQSTGNTYELDCFITSDWTGSGLCVYPMWNGNTGIAVTMYDSGWIRFFEYPGYAGEQYYAHAVIPYSMDSSYGLTYSESKDTFFHCYQLGGTYYISELEISEANLEAGTWGSIKTAF